MFQKTFYAKQYLDDAGSGTYYVGSGLTTGTVILQETSDNGDSLLTYGEPVRTSCNSGAWVDANCIGRYGDAYVLQQSDGVVLITDNPLPDTAPAFAPTVDTTAPVLASATVNGTSLVLTYTEADALDADDVPAASAFSVSAGGSSVGVDSVAIDGTAKTVTLTLASAVAYGQTVTVGYTDPTAGDDAIAIQDVSGNDAASLSGQSVTNNTPDTTAPVFSSAAVNGSALVLSYTDNASLDATNIPAAAAFSVSAGGSPVTVNSVAVDGAAKTVTLTLASAVAYGQTVTVGYTDPTAGDDANAIQDVSGNDAASLSGQSVTNNTASTGGGGGGGGGSAAGSVFTSTFVAGGSDQTISLGGTGNSGFTGSFPSGTAAAISSVTADRSAAATALASSIGSAALNETDRSAANSALSGYCRRWPMGPASRSARSA